MSRKDDEKDKQKGTDQAILRVTYLKKDGKSFWRGGIEHQGEKYYDPRVFTKDQITAIREEGKLGQALAVDIVGRGDVEKAGLPIIESLETEPRQEGQ